MKVFFESHSLGSKGCKSIAKASGIKRITNKHVKKPTNEYIRWGLDGLDKLTQYKAFQEGFIPTPAFTQKRETAQVWLNDGYTVLARKLLKASSGKGIHIITPFDQLVDAPVYTRLIEKTKEFRVHLFKGTPILVTEKRKKNGVPKHVIRSTHNGYVMCIKDIDMYHQHTTARFAEMAWHAVGCPDVAAVDIGYNETSDNYYVFEVNTAPGIQNPATVKAYKEAIEEWMSKLDMGLVKSATAETTSIPSPMVTPSVTDAIPGEPVVTYPGSIFIGKGLSELIETVAINKYQEYLDEMYIQPFIQNTSPPLD